MNKALILAILLLLLACEEIPSEEEIQIPHRISLDLQKISKDPLHPGAILSYNYTLLNTGKEDLFDVAIETRILRRTTGEVVKTEGEIVPMALVVFKERGIALPTTLKKGEYELISVGTYDDGKDTDSFIFSVEVEETEEAENKTEEKKEEFSVTLEKAPETAKEETKASPNGEKADVLISGYQYHPQVLNITVGTTVVWYNNDSVPHTATGSGFDSGPIPKGDTYEFTFTKAITKIYSSTITEGPYGTIHIREP